MSGKIKSKDLWDEAEIKKSAKTIADSVDGIEKQLKELVTVTSSAKKAFDSQAKSQGELKQKTQQLSVVDRELLKLSRQLEQSEAKLTKEYKEAQIAVLKKKEAVRQSNEELKKQAGITRKSGGLFKSMTKSILAAGAAYLSLRAAFNVVKKGLSTITGFEQGMSKVRAVTNAVQTEFKALSENAKLLGQTTSKSAVQISKLQLEFAKLGFSTKEILNATEATVQLSIAAGSDLASSATVAASTVRGFAKDAKDTQHIVDVMATAFSKSGLDLEKFKVSMANAQVAAEATGKTVEETTAYLSAIVDTGTDASKAGTDLRVIFSKLAIKGIDLNTALEDVNNSSNKVATAQKLVGDRAFSSLITLAKNREKTDELTKAYINSAGAAKRMATIMEDNLIGDTTKLSSAWEGLVLTLTSGGNSFTKFLRGAVQGVTNLVGAFQQLVEASPVKEIEAERKEVIKLTGAVQNNLLSEEDRLLALEKLKLIAPDVADGITLEAESYDKLNGQLDIYLNKSIQRIAIASLEEKEQKAIAKASKQRINAVNALNRAFEVLVTVSEEYRSSEGLTQEGLEGTITLLKKKVEAQVASGEAIEGAGLELMTEEQKQLSALNLAYANLTHAKEKETSITKNSVNPISQRIALLKEEFGITEDLAESNDEAAAAAELAKQKAAAAAAKAEKLAKKREERLYKESKKRLDFEIAQGKQKTDKIKEQIAFENELFDEQLEKELQRELDITDNLKTEEEKRLQIKKDNAKKEAEIERAKEDVLNAIKEAAGQIATDRFNANIDNKLATYESENKAEQVILQKRLDKGQISEKNYKKEIAKLNLKYRIEEAKAEKKKALFDIFINTLIEVTKTLAKPIQAIAVGAIGAANAAAVAAKPLPKFFKGVQDFQGGMAVVGDSASGGAQAELVRLASGEQFIVKNPTAIDLPRGTSVFPEKSIETQKALSGNMDDSNIVKGLKKIENKINTSGYYWTKKGLEKRDTETNTITILRGRRFK